MRGLFVHAALALFISLSVIALLAFGLGPSHVTFWSTSIGLVAQTPATFYFCRLGFRNFVDPGTTTGWGAFAITAGGTSIILGAFVVSAMVGDEIGWVVVAVSGQLLFGLWVFTRMLIHRN